MAIGGETIGRAYVRILADGSGFGEDIRRQIEGEDGEFQAAGRNSSKAYNEGFDQERDRWGKKSRKKQLDDLNKSVGKMHAAGEFAGSAYGRGLQDFLHKKFKDIGDQMFADINDGIKSGRLDFDSLDRQLDNLGPLVERATKKIKDAQEALRKEQEAAAVAAEKNEIARGKARLARIKKEFDEQERAAEAFRREQEREATAAEREEQRRGKARLARAKRDLDQQEKAYAEHTRRQALQAKALQWAEGEILRTRQAQFKNLGDKIEQFGQRTLRSHRERDSLRSDLERLGSVFPDVVKNTQEFENRFKRLSGVLGRSGRDVDRSHSGISRMGTTIGKMFGRGSRNDFLNFFGGFVSIGPRLIGMLSGVGGWVAGLGQQFSELQSKAGGGFGGFISAIGSSVTSLAATGLPGLAAGAIAVAASMEILLFSLGPLASALTLVAGGVLALAGSLAFALVGGLVAVGGAMVPFAAALGVGALALGGLQKLAKTKWMKDFKKDFEGLQKATAKEMFGDKGQNLKVFGGVLKTVKPLIIAIAGAMGDLIKEFGKVAQSKGFSDMIDHLSKVLPPMIETIGHIAGNLGKAFIGAFVAAEPYVTQFLGWLEKVTGAMAAAGQDKGARGGSPLAQFFDKAVGSAMRVWDLIKEVGKTLSTLFSAGKSTGDNLITKLADAARDLNKWLESAEGQKALKTMFADAETLFDKLGEIVGAVIDIVDALDTPTNRLVLFRLLDIAVDVLEFLADAFEWMDKINNLAIDTAADAWANLSEGIDDTKTKAEELANGTAWDTLMGHVKEVTDGTAWDSLKQKFKEVGNGEAFAPLKRAGSEIKTAFAPVGGFFSGLAQQIGASLAPGFANLKQHGSEAAQGIQSAWGTVTGFFAGIGQSIATNISTGLTTIRTRLSELPSQIVQAFTNLPANIWTFVQQMVAPFVWLYQYLVGASLIPELVMGIVGWFAKLPGLIAGALGDIGARFQIWLAGVPQKIQSAVGLVAGAFTGLATKAISRAGSIVSAFGKWVAGLPAKARQIATSVATGFTNLAGKIISKAGSLASRFASWVSSLAGKARSTAVSIIGAFSGMAGKIISKAGSIASKFGSWVAGLPGKAKTIAGNIANAFSGLAGKIVSKAGDIASKFAAWGSKAVTSAGRVANNIVNKFSGLASKIVNAIGNIVPKIKMPNIPRPTVQAIVKVIKPKGAAAGGIFASPTIREIGEAGPEAVVPLARALSRVDPAVRALSAFAQGINQPGTDSGPSVGRQIDVGGITINTPTTDPRAVASEVVNRMTFAAYI